MKLFSAVPICMEKISLVQMGLLKRKSPLNVIVPPFGLIRFIPVMVSNIKNGRFDSRVLYNAYPKLVIDSIENSYLRYAYNKYGDEVAVSNEYVTYKTQIDQYAINNIIVSKDLDNYDILLCTNYKGLSNLAYVGVDHSDRVYLV